jgi:hypothetical protein
MPVALAAPNDNTEDQRVRRGTRARTASMRAPTIVGRVAEVTLTPVSVGVGRCTG